MSVVEAEGPVLDTSRLSPEEVGIRRAKSAGSYCSETDGVRHFRFDLTDERGIIAHEVFSKVLGIPQINYEEFSGEVEYTDLAWRPERAPDASVTRQVVPTGEHMGNALVFYCISAQRV